MIPLSVQRANVKSMAKGRMMSKLFWYVGSGAGLALDGAFTCKQRP